MLARSTQRPATHALGGLGGDDAPAAAIAWQADDDGEPVAVPPDLSPHRLKVCVVSGQFLPKKDGERCRPDSALRYFKTLCTLGLSLFCCVIGC